MSSGRILISAGGTGGHLYPAQALAQDFKAKNPLNQILFIGGGLASSRYFDRTAFPFKEVPCSPLLLKNPLKFSKGIYQLYKGTKESFSIIQEFRPDVVVGFGSYYTVSTLLAAKLLKIPIVLHEANSIPGKANQWLAYLADSIALHFPETASFFKKESFEVGLPLRQGYQRSFITKLDAANYYGFSLTRPILLVFGGSQGAKAINLLLSQCSAILASLSVQVIHLCGKEDQVSKIQSQYDVYNIPACVKPFEDKMAIAWRAADVFIGRAGASTIAEALEFEVPGILIPYPYATNGHQEKNADFLVNKIKGAIKLLERDLTPEVLSSTLETFFRFDSLNLLGNSLRAYKNHPHRMTLSEMIYKRYLIKK